MRYAAVQVGAFADSARAHALRDSLERDGWTAYLRAAGGRWLVRVGPSQNLAYAELVAHALRRRGGEALVAQDSGPREAQGVAAFTRVNYGAHGMIARARWALAPDGRSLVVMEDPAAVENDPLPNGVFFGTEDGLRWMQLDSVWDAAPAPDWRRLGYGRAWLLAAPRSAGGAAADSLATATWAAVAETLAVPVAAARRAAFRASGMSMLWGIAQPGVAVLDSSEGAPPQRVLYPVPTGWRVGWDDEGTALLVGAPPEHPRDDSPASRWQRLDLASGGVRAAAPPDTSADAEGAPRWTEGPLLDATLDADTLRAGPIAVDGGRIVSEEGWIRLGGHRLGPGVALAATRGARYVVALVPDPAAKDGEPKEMLAVYVVSPDSLR